MRQHVRYAATHKDIFLLQLQMPTMQSQGFEKILYRANSQGEFQEFARVQDEDTRNRIQYSGRGFHDLVRMGSPLAYHGFFWLYQKSVAKASQRPDYYPSEFIQFLGEVMPTRNWVWIMSLVSVACAAWHQCHRQATRWKYIGWLIFVGLFNVAGLLACLALNHTTVLRCQACGKKRTLNQPACNRCHAELTCPQPEHTILLPT